MSKVSSGIEDIILTVRLNKFLAEKGLCSRRQADLKISQGLILVNGSTAKLGYHLKANDIVTYENKEYCFSENFIKNFFYLALNKPAGIECTCSRETEGNLIDFLENNPKFQELRSKFTNSSTASRAEELRLYPIGRLDKNSRGLIILTNDGKITHKLSHPKFEHEKEYLVRVDKLINKQFLEKLGQGVEIQINDTATKVKTMPAKVFLEDDTSFRIILKQGYKRQIRESCKVLGYKVLDLLRFRIAKLNLYELSLNEGEFTLVDNLYYSIDAEENSKNS